MNTPAAPALHDMGGRRLGRIADLEADPGTPVARLWFACTCVAAAGWAR
jgi:hypothetical protein